MNEDDILGAYNLPLKMEKYYHQLDTLAAYNMPQKAEKSYYQQNALKNCITPSPRPQYPKVSASEIAGSPVHSVVGSKGTGGPTEDEAAAISSHVYGGKSDDVLRGGWRLSSDQRPSFNDVSGLKSALYERELKDGTMEYVYATAGTEDLWRDGVQDLLQLIGLSEQYFQSVENAIYLMGEYGGNLSFTGHSLGGGLAAVNALATGLSAKTFNPAALSIFTKIRTGTVFSQAQIDAYIMLTDPLHSIQNQFGLMNNGTIHHRIPSDLSSVYNGHSLDNMMKPDLIEEITLQWNVFMNEMRSGIHRLNNPNYWYWWGY